MGADAASLGCLDLVSEARQAAADFLHCESHEVVYGPSMTALAFDLAAALEAELGEAGMEQRHKLKRVLERCARCERIERVPMLVVLLESVGAS